MTKKFDEWNTTKKYIDSTSGSDKYFKERDIWWCRLGINIGQEQNGKGIEFMRPVVIFKKFNRNLCWVLPLSTKVSKGSFFFPLLSESNTIRTVIIPQMRMLDSKRLHTKIDKISIQEYKFIKEKIIAFIQ